MFTFKIKNLNQEIENLKEIINRLNIELLYYQENNIETKVRLMV